MDLSIIIPAYNEQNRLPPTLERVISFLLTHYKGSYEIMIIDDGSSDGTDSRVEDFIHRYSFIRLIRFPQNRGRGAAVREGVRMANGNFILEMDADGSVNEEAIIRFLEYMNQHADVHMLIGSRNIKGAAIVTRQSMVRIFLGWIFLFCAAILFGWRDLKDRVNGFKMFRRAAAHDIFSVQVDTSFLAEAEIPYIADRRGWKYELLPVLWTDFRNSRIHPARDSWRSFWGLFKILMRDSKGEYKK